MEKWTDHGLEGKFAFLNRTIPNIHKIYIHKDLRRSFSKLLYPGNNWGINSFWHFSTIIIATDQNGWYDCDEALNIQILNMLIQDNHPKNGTRYQKA